MRHHLAVIAKVGQLGLRVGEMEDSIMARPRFIIYGAVIAILTLKALWLMKPVSSPLSQLKTWMPAEAVPSTC